MSWFFPVKVNVALAAMAVNPAQFDGAWRSDMQQHCKRLGLTPEEAAIVIVGNGLGIDYPLESENAVGVWVAKGKVDVTKDLVVDALSKMGFQDPSMWQMFRG